MISGAMPTALSRQVPPRSTLTLPSPIRSLCRLGQTRNLLVRRPSSLAATQCDSSCTKTPGQQEQEDSQCREVERTCGEIDDQLRAHAQLPAQPRQAQHGDRQDRKGGKGVLEGHDENPKALLRTCACECLPLPQLKSTAVAPDCTSDSPAASSCPALAASSGRRRGTLRCRYASWRSRWRALRRA